MNKFFFAVNLNFKNAQTRNQIWFLSQSSKNITENLLKSSLFYQRKIV
ncbi:hypothetical protein HMPREF0765_3356 [Sphingobacterium spiritivorum ATCC 33300]|uniref:Uncharacterized protein n=1 Tax=Sphingobacterium spiritivorum ATCC 33300 TaxID=525372 RepID=C2G1A0_SPHSI|nr:hypothetical protein HMPREF0765_3356 [Sphingobacterium spiritivorum ATCC 33300]